MCSLAIRSYEQEKHFTIHLIGEEIIVVSKPGLSDWDKIPPAIELLTKYPKLSPSDDVLLMGCHHGASSVYLARRLPYGQLSIIDHNHIALEMTRRTLLANNIANINFQVDSNQFITNLQKYDAVLIQIPKGRKLSRRWLMHAYLGLKSGGSFYIAGSNQAGIRSSLKDAMELFGAGQIMAYKKGNRICHFIKSSEEMPFPEWASAPGLTPGTWVEFSVSIFDQDYQIRSLPGVFSYDKVDPGTEMLISKIKICPGSKVLDVGCGFGIIGLFAASHGAGWVDFIDSDLLAIASTKETLAINRVFNVSVYTSDLLEKVSLNSYDLILSNPPFHAGQAIDFQITEALIRQSYQALNPGGQLQIVANRFIPYDRLFQEVFGNITFLTESGKYYVLSGSKSE